MAWLIENHARLRVHAFTAHYPQPLGALVSPPLTAALLAAPAEAHAPGQLGALAPPDDATRAAVRDALRAYGFKPTGRSKPSSEYLLRAQADGALRAINLAVDAGNAVSVQSGLPISVLDLERLGPPLQIRPGAAGESYVFNPAGQVLTLAGVPCLYDTAGPCANAIKDAQRTKTSDATQSTLQLIWSTAQLEERAQTALQLYARLPTSRPVHPYQSASTLKYQRHAGRRAFWYLTQRSAQGTPAS